jgi:hypothetical protein
MKREGEKGQNVKETGNKRKGKRKWEVKGQINAK